MQSQGKEELDEEKTKDILSLQKEVDASEDICKNSRRLQIIFNQLCVGQRWKNIRCHESLISFSFQKNEMAFRTFDEKNLERSLDMKETDAIIIATLSVLSLLISFMNAINKR